MSSDHNSPDYFKQRLYSVNHSGIRQDEVRKAYEDWSRLYDKDLAEKDYSAPQNMAVIMKQRYPEAIRSQVRILDVGAGTGLVAEELRALGFVLIDGLEPTTDMLDVAREKELYDNYYEEYLSADEPTSIPKNTYDCVTGASCFIDNHIPWESITELLRIVKPGGLILLGCKAIDTDYFRGFDAFLDELVRNGRLAKQDRVPGQHRIQEPGQTYILTVA